jgi:hypothetical protein
MGRHRYDGGALPVIFSLSRIAAVASKPSIPGHLYIHEHQMEIFFFKGFDCRTAIGSHHDGITALFQETDCEYLIHRIIFGQQYPEGWFLSVKGVASDQGQIAGLRGQVRSFRHSLDLYKIASAERHIRFDDFEVYPDPSAGVLDEVVGFIGVVVGNHTFEVYGACLFGLLSRHGANLARASDQSRGVTRWSFVRESNGSRECEERLTKAEEMTMALERTGPMGRI